LFFFFNCFFGPYFFNCLFFIFLNWFFLILFFNIELLIIELHNFFDVMILISWPMSWVWNWVASFFYFFYQFAFYKDDPTSRPESWVCHTNLDLLGVFSVFFSYSFLFYTLILSYLRIHLYIIFFAFWKPFFFYWSLLSHFLFTFHTFTVVFFI
jgi:hypothetical protein